MRFEVIVHWTKLFWIDILLYIYKKPRNLNYIFRLWTLLNYTHEKNIFSCWSRKEDLRYGLNLVTKSQRYAKSRDLYVFSLKMKCYSIKNNVTCLWIFWHEFDKKTEEKLKDSLQLLWPLKYGTFFRFSSSENSSLQLIDLPSFLKIAASCSHFVPATKCCCAKA